MTDLTAEQKIRASLHVIRIMQNVLPPALANRFNKIGTSKVKLDPDITQEAISADGTPCDWLIPQTSTRTRSCFIFMAAASFTDKPHFICKWVPIWQRNWDSGC